MTEEELHDTLRQLQQRATESPGVEAKSARDELPRKLWETMSAFSNSTGGGVLLLGVDERARFAVTGVANPAKLQADLASLCADQMEPPLRPLITTWDVQGKAVISAEFPELDRAQKPCYYRGGGLPNGAFIRVGDGDRKLNAYEV
ncbi:MAG TPA: ATP-binding protein, partial [Longimicrobium sp.]|nr:ATP-binding protein [Longimicrobium sp.]